MLKLNQNWKRNQNLMNQIQEFCQNCLIMMFALWQLLSVTQDWIMTSLSSLNSLNSSSFTMMLTLILYKYVSVSRIILCFIIDAFMIRKWDSIDLKWSIECYWMFYSWLQSQAGHLKSTRKGWSVIYIGWNWGFADIASILALSQEWTDFSLL